MKEAFGKLMRSVNKPQNKTLSLFFRLCGLRSFSCLDNTSGQMFCIYSIAICFCMHAAVSGFLGLKVNFLLFWVVILLRSEPSKKVLNDLPLLLKGLLLSFPWEEFFFHSVLLNAKKYNSLSLSLSLPGSVRP